MPGYEKIGKYVIYLDDLYYLTYTGGKRELPKREQDEYNKIINSSNIINDNYWHILDYFFKIHRWNVFKRLPGIKNNDYRDSLPYSDAAVYNSNFKS